MSLGERQDIHTDLLHLGGREVTEVVVHHSVSATDTTAEQIRAWHLARGFNGPGYHWLIREASPGVWEIVDLRDEALQGAHARGHNPHSLGICVAGDYTRYPLSQGARDQLLGLLTWLCRQLGLEPHQVRGHREVERPGYTECPGFAMDPIRDALGRALST